MKVKSLHKLLIETARKLPEKDCVPASFEKRIMSHIDAEGLTDALTLWAKGLWRAAIPCLTLMMLIGTLNVIDRQESQVDPLAEDLELTMLKPFDELSFEELW